MTTDTPRTDAHLSHLNMMDGNKVGIPNETTALLRTLERALRGLYEETADYIRINNLGDVHHNRSMQRARDALNVDEIIGSKP